MPRKDKMESGREDQTGSIPLGGYASSDLGIADFMDDQTNLNQFIDDLIWEEDNALNSIVNFTSQVVDFDHQQNLGGCLANNHLFSPIDHSLFDFNDVAMNHVARISPDCSTLSEFPNNIVETDEEESSATTSNTSGKKKQKKSDRSITLISERRRRSRMKEKLYALRSLVPTITKMDKASIIGDAVLYVQDLQMQAKKLRSEIAGLDSSFTKGNNHNNNNKKKLKSKKINAANSCSNPTIKKILKMDIIEVEEREFHARIVSKKEKGVAVLLYKALQSLTTFIVQTSNLATHLDNYVFTFTLHTAEEVDMNLPSLKMWVTRAFLAQGFDFETSLSA